MEQLIVNLSGKVRKEILNGREHLVAPLTMIVPGVLHGSQGPLYYSPEAIAQNSEAWNNIPIVLSHPASGSARNPDVINNSGLGTIYNARIDKHSLKAEGWFDVDRTREVSEECFNALVAGETMELSTGVGVDRTPVTNGQTPDGIAYTSTVSNLRPDHLAILMDTRGACSIEEGCGVFNEMSNEDIREALSAKLHDRLNLGSDQFLFIVAVFKKSVVYEFNGTTYKLKYKRVKGDTLELSNDAPVPVKRMTSFEPVSNDSKKESSMSKLTENERSTIVAELVSNCDCWEEADVDTLNSFEDEKLVKLQAHTKKVFAANAAPEVVVAPVVEEVVVDNATPVERMSSDDWFASAPEEIVNTFRYAKSIEDGERNKLTEKLLRYTPEDQKEAVRNEFASSSLERLRTLEAIVPDKLPTARRQPSYGGSQPALNSTTNAADALNEDRLELPSMDFNDES
jgi:hypothetical protein|tara:strand:- start:871 stop:2238 length:1368 start_codon:yes stop_codon:yes gene_type:complete